MNPIATQSNEAGPSSSVFTKISNTKVEYRVLHGSLKWTIEKFSAFPTNNDKYCSSPIFDLKGIWWHIAFHPRARICGRNKISLNLIRHKSDNGPRTVNVSYRLGIENDKNTIWFKPEENIIFGKGDCFGFQTSVLGHLEDFMAGGIANNNDSLSILCEMYVLYSINVSSILSNVKKKTVDTDLPSNLISLYKTQQHNDILIEIPKIRVRAHKSVLSARSKTLARLLEDGKSFIQLLCTPSCLNCVILYMYSGNFDFLARNAVFSIGLYELACELSLHKLRDFLTPYRIELKSQIIDESFKIAWKIHKFEIADLITDSMESSVYFDKSTGIGIKLCLPELVATDNLEIHVKVSGILAALDVSFEMYLLNNTKQPTELIPAIALEDSNVVFKNLIFTYSFSFSVDDVITSCVLDGNVCIKFACKRYSLMHLSNTTHYATMTMTSYDDTDTWLEDLAADIRTLLMTGFLSDVTLLTASGQSFKLHRSILAARSAYFHRLFFYDQYKNQILLQEDPKIEPRILELMLTFMYSGTIKDRPDIYKGDVLEMYRASEEFSVNSMKSKCVKYLSLNLDPEFVFNVLRSAIHFKNSLLVDICKNYIIECGVQNISEGSEEGV